MADTWKVTPEDIRLREANDRVSHWKRWGPYVSERAWGTVREDYSKDGSAWEYLPFEHSHLRAYRWNEDGLAGICDRHQHICFALAMWNGKDPILKERMYGVTGNQGNHGEDCKDYYFYLDSTPTHSYMKYLYKYPQQEFPYKQLLEENKRRGKMDPEYELVDTGIFNDDRYFDVFVEYVKCKPEDILIKINIHNRGPEAATLQLLPTVWFRNTWSWDKSQPKPRLHRAEGPKDRSIIQLDDSYYGERFLYAEGCQELLFTENETNVQALYHVPNPQPYVKDAFHQYVIHGDKAAVNPKEEGTKAAALYMLNVPAGGSQQIRLRLTNNRWPAQRSPFSDEFEKTFTERIRDANDFYRKIIPETLSEDAANVMRQSIAGMLWSKQFYHYELRRWLVGDPDQPPPPHERLEGRNHEWTHLYNSDVISMPDKWEYPWYAAWDLAFHCIALALVDPDFAKDQLILMLREWYMHPNGQIPAYEWAFGDVNPPVHAWAAWRVYKIDARRRGTPDRAFLEKIFHKLMLNFTWWVNRKDALGNNIFEGGFLGLDNIGVFDRSAKLPSGGRIEQSDGTSWMAMFTLNLLSMAIELAEQNPIYEDVASKFWEHFLYIARAMSQRGDNGEHGLWDEEDGFFYDVLHSPETGHLPMRVRSMVGLIPLFAIDTIEPDVLEKLDDFKRRMDWFIENRSDLCENLAKMDVPGEGERRLMSIVDSEKLRSILKYMLDENEFLSPYGIRALSRHHLAHPYSLELAGVLHSVDYEPGESHTGLFGGNSNWRGPIWMPMNFLLIEALQRMDYYLGDDFKVEHPTGSGQMHTLWEVAEDLSLRLSSIFLRDSKGHRAVFGENEKFQNDPHWRDYVPFHEYFHGDNGKGLGASHQTGWTGLVAKLLQQSGAKFKTKDGAQLEKDIAAKSAVKKKSAKKK